MYKSLAVNQPLKTPPKLESNTLRVVPLGGLGEVGRNMACVEFVDPIRDGGMGAPRILLLDCGVLFPGDDEPGVDLILPDFSYIADRLQDVEALVLTHGHEDHIGAVPFLLKLREDIPVVGSGLTIELVKKKLTEHRIKNAKLRVVGDFENLRFGPFMLEFLPVNHSIPDAMAVFIKTAAGNILDTGDFKMDQTPVDGRLTDLRAFSRANEDGVDLFMVDSTNAENPGFVTSEAVIGAEIERLFSLHREGKIFVASFASHVHRVQHVVNAALKYGRKVVLVGRSMEGNMKIAEEIGKLFAPSDVLLDLKDAKAMPPERLVLMVTGSQGESMAALSRMARGEHPTANIEEEDTVIMASSSIPGNEKSITLLINSILMSGAKVYHAKNAKVHCSGHANQGELQYIYNVVRPKNVLPIHGEVRHLLANRNAAASTGIDKTNIPTITDGGVVDVKNGVAKVVGRVECGFVYVDGRAVGDDKIGEFELQQRRILSEEGFVAVTVIVDLDSKKVISRPKVVAKGVAEDDSVFYRLPAKVRAAVEKAMVEDGENNIARLQKVVRRTAGKWVAKELHRSPMILPLVSNAQETAV